MGSFKREFLSTIIVNLGVMSLGTVSGWSSPSLPNLEKEFFNQIQLKEMDKAWIASIALLGSLVACPLTGILIKKFGRKKAIFPFAIFLAISWVILGSAQTLWMIFFGRFLTGLFSGSFKIIAPIYVAEFSDKKHRGFFSGFYEIFLNLAILLTNVFGLFLNWSQLSYASTVFPLLLTILIVIVPESPIYLQDKGQMGQALKSTAWFKGKSTVDSEVITEINMIKKSLEVDFSSTNSLTYSDIFFKRQNVRPLLITIWLKILEQFTGYSAFINYTMKIFIQSGDSGASNSGFYTIIVSCVQLIGTILSTLMSDRCGRKPLLISSLLLMSIPLTVLGIYFIIPPGEKNFFPDWTPLFCMICFIFPMSFGISPISSMYPGEILPIRIKDFGASLSISISAFSGFLVTFGFEAIQTAIGIYTCFWIFAIVCLIGAVTVYLFVPETKGKSLLEIEEMFKNDDFFED